MGRGQHALRRGRGYRDLFEPVPVVDNKSPDQPNLATGDAIVNLDGCQMAM